MSIVRCFILLININYYCSSSPFQLLRPKYKAECWRENHIKAKQTKQQEKQGKIETVIFLENTQNCSAYISATKYPSEVVLYSNRTAGYPLSPHITTFAVASLQAE